MIFNVQMIGGVNTKDATATAKDILNGKSAYVNNEKVIGEMADNGDVNSAIQNGILKEGYTSGGQIENLSAENVRENVVIGGIEGLYKQEITDIFDTLEFGSVFADDVDDTGQQYTVSKPIKMLCFYPVSQYATIAPVFIRIKSDYTVIATESRPDSGTSSVGSSSTDTSTCSGYNAVFTKERITGGYKYTYKSSKSSHYITFSLSDDLKTVNVIYPTRTGSGNPVYRSFYLVIFH